MRSIQCNSKWRVGALISSALLLVGCANLYRIDNPKATTAKLELISQNLGNYAESDFWIFHDDQCKKSPGVGRAASFIQGVNRQTLEIEAARELVLRVRYREYDDLPSHRGWWGRSCLVMARLKPIAGKTYQLHQRGIGDRTCRIQLLDAAIATTPDEFKVLPLSEAGDECLMGEAKRFKRDTVGAQQR